MSGFEFEGKQYELKFNMKRIEMIESVTDMPTMAALHKYQGMLALQALKVYFGYTVKEAGSDSFVAPKKGMEMAEILIESEGYADVCGLVLECLERDCPFFFRAG